MKHFIFTILLSILFSNVHAQKVGVKEKITIENAHLVKEYNKDDIESLVTYYFASRIRKDDKWINVLPKSTEWSSRMKTSIDEHNKWNFVEFKNLGLYKGKYGTYVKVYFVIDIKGHREGGEDEVEITEKNGKWIISVVPI